VNDRIFEGLPLAAFYFAAAGKNQSAPSRVLALAGLGRLAIASDAGTDRAEEGFIGCRIVNSSGNWTAVLDEANGDAELGNPFHKLACAIEWVDDPDARALQADGIVDALFREPAFAFAQQFFVAVRRPRRDRLP
jgi:hypothetical protein